MRTFGVLFMRRMNLTKVVATFDKNVALKN